MSIADPAAVVRNSWVSFGPSSALEGHPARFHGGGTKAHVNPEGWQRECEQHRAGTMRIRAAAVVNAEDAWIDEVPGPLGHLRAPEPIRLVRSTHSVIANLFEGEQPYILQNPRHRLVLAIQFQEHLSFIGAIDVLHTGPLHHVAITSAATSYLCASINRYCKQPIPPEYALWSHSGVRSLYDDDPSETSAITRDYLTDQAWAATVQDIPPRRAKLGLRLTPPEVARLDLHLGQGQRASL